VRSERACCIEEGVLIAPERAWEGAAGRAHSERHPAAMACLVQVSGAIFRHIHQPPLTS